MSLLLKGRLALAKARLKAADVSRRLLLGPVGGRVPWSFVGSLVEAAWRPDIKRHIVAMTRLSPPMICEFPLPAECPPNFRRHYADSGRMQYQLRDVIISPDSGMVWTESGIIVGESIGSLNKALTFGHCLHEPLLPRQTIPAGPPLIAFPAPNYFHWLLEILPRVILSRRAAPEAFPLIARYAPRYLAEALQAWLGPTWEQQTVCADRPVHVREIILTAQSAASGFVPAADIALLRATFQPTACAGSGHERSRLYISRRRSSGRHLAAEDNVERFFQRAGFEVLYAEGVPWLEQVRRFAAAEVIAGLHGAGLANLVFAPPDATLLELFPPDYFNDCYARLAVTAGLRYRFFNLDEATLADDRTLTTALTAWLA